MDAFKWMLQRLLLEDLNKFDLVLMLEVSLKKGREVFLSGNCKRKRVVEGIWGQKEVPCMPAPILWIRGASSATSMTCRGTSQLLFHLDVSRIHVETCELGRSSAEEGRGLLGASQGN